MQGRWDAEGGCAHSHGSLSKIPAWQFKDLHILYRALHVQPLRACSYMCCTAVFCCMMISMLRKCGSYLALWIIVDSTSPSDHRQFEARVNYDTHQGSMEPLPSATSRFIYTCHASSIIHIQHYDGKDCAVHHFITSLELAILSSASICTINVICKLYSDSNGIIIMCFSA